MYPVIHSPGVHIGLLHIARRFISLLAQCFFSLFCRQAAWTLIWKTIFEMNVLDRKYFLLLIFVTTALSANSNDEFQPKLRQLVDDLLGAEEFQVGHSFVVWSIHFVLLSHNISSYSLTTCFAAIFYSSSKISTFLLIFKPGIDIIPAYFTMLFNLNKIITSCN